MKHGIVDVGSNTIRLSVYNCEGQDFKLLMNKKITAGLAGYIKSGELSDRHTRGLPGALLLPRARGKYRR